MSVSKENIMIGIDLGTTTSEAYVYIDKKVKLIKFERITPAGVIDDSPLIDSVFGVDPTLGDEVVSDMSHLKVYPENYITEVKRCMGKTEDEIKKILKSNNEKRKTLKIDTIEYSPEEVSAKILKHIKKIAEDEVDKKINEAVITVPANFNNNQRQATIKAGQIAGFTKVNIIAEPTAAALAYTVNKSDDNYKKIMIFDLGGGTFDVSVGEYQNQVLDVKASAGDNHLGGKDFDRAIRDHICKEFKKEHGIDLSKDTGAYFQLLLKSEDVKKRLSKKEEVPITEPAIVEDSKGKKINLNMKLSREKFISLISKKLDKTKLAIKKSLKDAKWKKEDIDIVLLVGGSTRIPYVYDLVKKSMNKDPQNDIDPDLAVSQGAGEYCKILIDGGGVIMDVLPMSLGTNAVVEYMGQMVPNFYSEILPENWPLLKENDDEAGKFFMIHDNQESVDFKVYQRQSGEESPFIDDNNPNFTELGELKVDGIPPKKAGEESISAKYMADANGVIKVKVLIDSTGKEFNKEFQLNEVDNSNKKIIDAEEIEDNNLDIWKDSKIAKNHTLTIKLADNELKKNKHEKLSILVEDLKKAIIDNNVSLAEEKDMEINDFLFELT